MTDQRNSDKVTKVDGKQRRYLNASHCAEEALNKFERGLEALNGVQTLCQYMPEEQQVTYAELGSLMACVHMKFSEVYAMVEQVEELASEEYRSLCAFEWAERDQEIIEVAQMNREDQPELAKHHRAIIAVASLHAQNAFSGERDTVEHLDPTIAGIANILLGSIHEKAKSLYGTNETVEVAKAA